MDVELYSSVSNSEYIVPLFIEHYRKAFGDISINVANCGSTDKSIKLLKDAGCNITNLTHYVPYYKEPILTHYKNNCWKTSKAKWIIVCDIDELCHITHADLANLDHVDVVQFEGYNMIDIDDVRDLKLMLYGTLSQSYSKCAMFKKSIGQINYNDGSHICNLPKHVRILKNMYKLLHYKKSFFNFKNFCLSAPNCDPKLLRPVWSVINKDVKKVL